MMSALIMPKYCRRFYGTNITAGPLWAFNNLLQDSELDTWMQEVFRDEMYEKECADIGNANVNLMFAGAVSEALGGDQKLAAQKRQQLAVVHFRHQHPLDSHLKCNSEVFEESLGRRSISEAFSRC